ncbi:helix-turn-helix domain-containing protein [Alteromonas pelagimontana]|uniref:Helix-turn-helix domain-containing protein n=1 Tax=Alteromonas pelagimontana TaxID=1858656 RepID=A0A6M4M9U5_9ALTE|nr:helix-turn-helix domain-containing protein [Alteromonas pelagimontana]QJR79941.1 helix-turn-helix domain-containing protein [Alteromonas pelagimontana]
MQYKGLFWSAILRSLLSLRRDIGLSDNGDDQVLSNLSDIEQGQFEDSYLNALLTQLCPVDQRTCIGKSLIGYFDFNKMGNLVVLLTACKNIEDALSILSVHYRDLFDANSQFEIADGTSDSLLISWREPGVGLMAQIQIYFLFTLFRHLAGRQFDFAQMSAPANPASSPASLLAPLSQAAILPDDQIKLLLDKKWLTQPSFYYSAQMKKMLEATLAAPETAPLKQQIRNAFLQASSPARIRAEWVASQLGQTESAFRRQLRQENISFSALLKDYIHDKSCQYLIAGEKTEDTAHLLGFSDRRSFERSFKEHAGISAGQVRQLGSRMRFQRGNSNLLDVVENLPPLPATIQSLLALDDEQMTLPRVVELVERDPIFQAHIMSKASRAIYGLAPQTLEQAIGRNLGLGNIKHLAVIFAAQQLLTTQCRFSNIQQLTDAMLLSQTIFSKLYSFAGVPEDDKEIVRQLILFGLLSLFLVFHEDCVIADGALTLWEQSQSLTQFNTALYDEFGLCLYGATSLMLLRWGFKNEVNQQLWKLCQMNSLPSSDLVHERILVSHNVAFTAMVFTNAANSEQRYPQLSPAELDTVDEILALWKAPAT